MLTKFKAQELEIHRLKARVKLLKDREGVVAERSKDDATIKRRNLDEGEAAAERVSNDTEEMATILTSMGWYGKECQQQAERVSNDTEEMATILTSMDATIVLASGVAEVSTGSGSIPIAGPPAAEVPTGSDVVPIAGPIFATATVIDAQVARELKEQIAREDQRMFEQTQQRKPWFKKQKRDYYMVVIKSNLGWKVKDFRGMTFEEIEAKFTTIWKQIKSFKRKGIRFEQESAKRLKTTEEVPEEVKSLDEVHEEKVKEMMQLVPIEEVYVESL
nr:hypothetical protein [Tanacetum cinerariifolium]